MVIPYNQSIIFLGPQSNGAAAVSNACESMQAHEIIVGDGAETHSEVKVVGEADPRNGYKVIPADINTGLTVIDNCQVFEGSGENSDDDYTGWEVRRVRVVFYSTGTLLTLTMLADSAAISRKVISFNFGVVQGSPIQEMCFYCKWQMNAINKGSSLRISSIVDKTGAGISINLTWTPRTTISCNVVSIQTHYQYNFDFECSESIIVSGPAGHYYQIPRIGVRIQIGDDTYSAQITKSAYPNISIQAAPNPRSVSI